MRRQNRTRMALNIDLAVFSKLETAESGTSPTDCRFIGASNERDCGYNQAVD